jgi:cytochrome c
MKDAVVMILLVTIQTGCGGPPDWASGRKGLVSGPGTGAASLEDQIERGARLYDEYCADCHGGEGQGSPAAPALVGQAALPPLPRDDGDHMRSTEFHTGADVLAFVRAEMPVNDPGSLTSGDYLDLVAFVLHVSGAAIPGEPVTAESSGLIPLRGDDQVRRLARWW